MVGVEKDYSELLLLVQVLLYLVVMAAGLLQFFFQYSLLHSALWTHSEKTLPDQHQEALEGLHDYLALQILSVMEQHVLGHDLYCQIDLYYLESHLIDQIFLDCMTVHWKVDLMCLILLLKAFLLAILR